MPRIAPLIDSELSEPCAAGQAEVGHVGIAVPVEQDVRGLQVAVEESLAVRMVDGAGHDRDQPRGGAGIVAEPLGLPRQAAAIHELHAEERPIFVLAHLIDRHDVRVIQVGRELGLAEESLSLRRGRHRPGQDHLQGDEPFQPLVAGLVNDTHATARELLEQFIVADGPLRPGSGQVSAITRGTHRGGVGDGAGRAAPVRLSAAEFDEDGPHGHLAAREPLQVFVEDRRLPPLAAKLDLQRQQLAKELRRPGRP